MKNKLCQWVGVEGDKTWYHSLKRKKKKKWYAFFHFNAIFCPDDVIKIHWPWSKKERRFFCVSYGEKNLVIGGSGEKIRFLAVALLESMWEFSWRKQKWKKLR